jgi:DNA-binding NtrC family response regulator
MEKSAPHLDDPGEHAISERMQPLVGLLERVGKSDEHVIVSGTRGSDREWVARFIHAASPRQPRPFVVYAGAPNRSEMPAAVRRDNSVARAWFVATGGTLFIVDLYDLPDRDQAQLLRFLESRDSLTAAAPRRAPVRVVAATRSDLATTPHPASLRSSLFHRLNVLHVHIPPEAASAVDSEDDAPQSYSTFKEEKTRLLEAWEPTYLRELLSQVGGNLALAARTAGIARAHLYRLLKKYRLAR